MTRDELERAVRACEQQVCNPWVSAEALAWWVARRKRRKAQLREAEREGENAA